jgi:hypothetical protein
VGAEWWRPVAVRPAPSAVAAAPAEGSAVPFAALLIFTCVLLLAPQAFLPGLGRVHVALLVGAFAIAAHCWTRFATGRPLMRRTREMGLVGALLAWAIATLPLSIWPAASARILFNDYLKALGVFWLIGNTITTLGRLRTVAWVLSLTAAPLAAAGVWHFLSHDVAAAMSGRIAGYNAPSVVNPNDLALMLNLILPLTVALFLISRRPAVRGFLAGLLALEASGIIVTFSRGGFLTLATTFLLYLGTLRRWREWRWAVAALVLAVVAVPLLPPGYLNRLATIVNIHADKTGSAQERWAQLRPALVYALTHPLVGDGLGLNNLTLYAMTQSSGVVRADPRACLQVPTPTGCLFVHNVYLAYAMDLGWPGVVLFLLLLVSSIQSAVRVRDRCRGVPALRELSALAEAIRIALVASAVAALFYPEYIYFYFYCAPAFAVAAGAVFEAEARPATEAPALAGAQG